MQSTQPIIGIRSRLRENVDRTKHLTSAINYKYLKPYFPELELELEWERSTTSTDKLTACTRRAY
jgi:hypothetical protein